MKKIELIQYIQDNYPDDEELIWQVVAKGDVEDSIDKWFSTDKWNAFVVEDEKNLNVSGEMFDAALVAFQRFEFYEEPDPEVDNPEE